MRIQSAETEQMVSAREEYKGERYRSSQTREPASHSLVPGSSDNTSPRS